MLESPGYTVLDASSALAALELSRAHESTIHLLITDIQMPKMNGIELAHQLMHERPGINVQFISGYFGEQDPGIRHPVLTKPFSMSDLLRNVAKSLKGD